MGDLQATIESVQAVQKCKIIEENGIISQIFIEANLLSDDESARVQEIKSLIRAIVGAASLTHNVELDYRKIKVVEYQSNGKKLNEVHPRIRIVAAYQRRYPTGEIVVELSCHSQLFTGKAFIGDDLALSSFQAFQNAFNEMKFGSVSLVYIQCLNNDFARERIVLVKLTHTSEAGDSDILMGVAQINEDLPLAVVKATLNAVNRRIVLLS